MKDLAEYINLVPEIKESNNYWFVRTMGGKLYNPFLFKKVIAIDYDKIPEDKVKELITGDIDEYKSDYIKKCYAENHRPGLIINNLKRFYKEMKIGDIVVIPDNCGNHIAVGVIEGEVHVIDGIEIVGSDGKIKVDQTYRRSRKVKWLAAAKRNNFNPYLYRLLNTHQTISHANSYHEYIDIILHDFYKRGTKYNYVMNVRQKYGLNAKSVYGSLSELITLAEEFLAENGIHENADAIETKISVNSPGYIALLGVAGTVLFVICALVIFFNGGGMKYKNKDGVELEIKSHGFLEALSRFLNSRKDRLIKDQLVDKIKNLEIDNSADIIGLLGAVNEKNQNP